jgi:sugar phosphate isomerase/epimerase
MSWPIGASTGSCAETPIVGVVRELHAAGCAGIEIGTPPRHFDLWQRTQVQALAAELAATGIRPVSIHSPFGGLLDLSAPNPHHRYAAIGAILMSATILQELGGAIVIAHPSDVERARLPDVASRLSVACESLRTLHHACARMGLTLAIETPLPHLIGGAPDEFAQILDHIGPDARVCLDTGHTWLGRHWDEFARLTSGRVVHVHAHDNRGTYDDHLPPGDGHIDWARVGASLRAAGFEGWLMLELNCTDSPLPEYFSRAARQLHAGVLHPAR